MGTIDANLNVLIKKVADSEVNSKDFDLDHATVHNTEATVFIE